MTVPVIPLETRLDRRWREYLEARDRAERTDRIEDGIAAGRAWRAWLNEFVAPEHKHIVEEVVVGGRG